MKTVIAAFWLAILAGTVALPQATTVTPAKKTTAATTKKAVPTKAASTGKATPPPAATKTGVKTVAGKKAVSKTGIVAPVRKTAGKTAGKTTGKSSKKAPVATVRQRGQMAPTPDRYREIQTALAQKGYLTGEPSGVWDADSADAMKRFQTDQKLT